MNRAYRHLTLEQRRAFSALFSGVRSRGEGFRCSRQQIADWVNEVLLERDLDRMLLVDCEWIRWVESAPSEPLSSPHRLSALLEVLGLTWAQALETLGVPVSVIGGST